MPYQEAGVAESVICPHCGREVPLAKRCPHCGQILPKPKRKSWRSYKLTPVEIFLAIIGTVVLLIALVAL